MDSFLDLGLAPEIVESLAAEGIEIPTPFQEQALPVLRRGNNLVGRAGPGAGTLVTYGAALLDRLEPGDGRARVVVLAPTRDRADALARSLAGLAVPTGHGVAALGSPWALPDRASFLFATPDDLLSAVRASRIKLDGLEALVVDGAAEIEALGDFPDVETLSELVPSDAQRVVLSLPSSETVEAYVEGHVKRAVHVPPKARGEEEGSEVPHRGRLRYLVLSGDREEAVLALTARLLDDGDARHVVLLFASADEAADVGDRLTLHGYGAGAPGEASMPVWLGVDDREVQRVLSELDDSGSVATVSVRPPPGPDSLDRRHGRGGDAFVLLRGREMPQLRATARVAGYTLDPAPEPGSGAPAGQVERFRARLERALEEEDLAPHFLLLEPLTRRHSAAEVAAAAVALLRKATSGFGGGATHPAPEEAAAPAGEKAWVRLFMSLGHKDDAGPGDILGAITGEANVDGDQVGRIDIRETFSLVEVDRSVAQTVIEAMNGITVKGRSLRVDYDRKGGRGGGRSGRRSGS